MKQYLPGQKSAGGFVCLSHPIHYAPRRAQITLSEEATRN